jgi:hypothetical protein
MKAAGGDIVGFGAGEADFDTLHHIKGAGGNRIRGSEF